MPNVRLDWPAIFDASPQVVVSTVSSGVSETLQLNLTPDRAYYLSGDDQADTSTGQGDLMRMLRLAFASYNTASLTATVSLTSDFRCQIIASEDAEIHWNHANTTPGLAEYFGFDSSTTTVLEFSATSLNQPYGIWRPGRGMWDTRPLQPIVGGILMSLSGDIEISRVAMPTRTRDLKIQLITPERALEEYAEATRPYDTFEHLWLEGATLGSRLRLYYDETEMGASDYAAYKIRDKASPIEFNSQTRAYWRDVTLALQGAT